MDKETYYGVSEYSDTVTVSLGDITVDTIDLSDTLTINSGSTYATTITLDDTHWADNITWEQVEFEDQMPTVAKVEDMCNDYPALAKAYENFQTVYKLVEQDYKGKQDD